jgi:hypothetical protein
MSFRAQRKTMFRGGFGKRGSYQEIKEVGATLVAKLLGTRCSGASRIPRRSSCSGQQDPGEVVFVDLAGKKICDHVREVG